MPQQEEMESYAILLGGGLVILGLIAFAQPAPRTFIFDGLSCDPQGVMAWLNRKLNEGKITAQDIQRLLNTDISVRDWIDTVWGRRGFNILDITQLIDVCRGAPAPATSSPCPCLPFCP